MLDGNLNVDLLFKFESVVGFCLSYLVKHIVQSHIYSVGLVEHFSEDKRKKVIQNHFVCCEKGGVVIIRAPTPTVKYRVTRKIMELLRVWQFWDEYPIHLNQLIDEIRIMVKLLTVE